MGLAKCEENVETFTINGGVQGTVIRTVSKTVVSSNGTCGFESHLLRHVINFSKRKI